MSQTTDDVTVEWFRSAGAEVDSHRDGYTFCRLKMGTTTQEVNEDGVCGPVMLEFGFSKDGTLFDAVIGTYQFRQVNAPAVVYGPDIEIPRPVTRDRVRKLASALGLELPEQPT